jgi:predicted amidohydrolase YtcJ
MAPTSTRRTLLRGGRIYTPTFPAATSMLVVGDRIAAIGAADTAAAHADHADDIVELDGRLVTPGFVDAHVHLAATGFALASVDLGGAASLAVALERLRAYASEHQGPVLFAHGWDESTWPDHRHPTRHELDQIVGDVPAYVARVDSHSAVISSALLALQPDLVGRDGWSDDGRVERDAHHAARDVTHRLWTETDRTNAIRRALTHAASKGVVSVHELNAPHIAPFDDFRLISEVARHGPNVEVVPYWGQLFSGADLVAGVRGYAGDLCMDGAIGSRTAAMNGSYSDFDTSGHLYLDRIQVRDHVVACTQRGKQAGFHVIGDRAMQEVVAGLRAAADIVGVDVFVAARHRLEHVEMPDDDAIATMAELGIVASVQPAFDATWGAAGQLYEQRLGRDRAAPMNPYGRMHRAGVTLAFGSDSPITPIDPWAAVVAAAHHHEPAERLDTDAGIAAHTRGGRRACRDDAGGTLVEGAAATYAVWDQQGPLDDLGPDSALPRCFQTVVSGHVIYDRDRNF